MKRLLCLSLLLVAPFAAAAPKSDAEEPSSRHERRGLKSSLTEEQREKLHDLKRAHRKAVSPIREKLADELWTLRRQLRQGADEKALAKTLDAIKALRADLRGERERFQEQAAAVLTPEQRARLLLAKSRAAKSGLVGRRGGFRRRG